MQAEQDAFDELVKEVALVNRAQDVWIEVTDEEACEEAQSVRGLLETEDVQNEESKQGRCTGNNGRRRSHRRGILRRLYGNGYKQSLMIDQLKDYERENELKPWNIREEEIVEAYKTEEAARMERFREEIGRE